MLIRPVRNSQCVAEVGLNPAGKAIKCLNKATMKIDDKPVCDKHAEDRMVAECGCKTTIHRVN